MSNYGHNGGLHDPDSVGNFWTSLSEWPVPILQPFYMQLSNKLTNSPPTDVTSVSYTYDPFESTPMYGGNNLPGVGAIRICGSADQIEREKRDDVVVFDTGVLEENLPVVGHIQARLFVSSSAVDTDFVVTVSDLSGGKSMLVRYGAVRMRWREGEEHPSTPLVPGEVYAVDVDLDHTAYIFAKGHRLRVAISSAAYPYYDANTNTVAQKSHLLLQTTTSTSVQTTLLSFCCQL